jgi:hypothetical protein
MLWSEIRTLLYLLLYSKLSTKQALVDIPPARNRLPSFSNLKKEKGSFVVKVNC